MASTKQSEKQSDKFESPERGGSKVTHYVIVRRKVPAGDKNEARSFSIISKKSTEQICDEIRSLVSRKDGAK